MKKLLAIVALVVVGPAFGQHDPNDPNDPRTNHRIRALNDQSKIPQYVGDIYYGRDSNANPDFESGGLRWKAPHHRAHPASHRHKTAQQK
jgi:hypothetical protein